MFVWHLPYKTNQSVFEKYSHGLSRIVDKIDKDHDEFVSQSELAEWLKNVTRSNIQREVEKKWEEFSKVNTLDDYLKHYYSALDYCKTF